VHVVHQFVEIKTGEYKSVDFNRQVIGNFL